MSVIALIATPGATDAMPVRHVSFGSKAGSDGWRCASSCVTRPKTNSTLAYCSFLSLSLAHDSLRTRDEKRTSQLARNSAFSTANHEPT
mmetsp:Transcript_5450/g.8046  ORF Transcript_5450/g.8046 Transcript_5450/m.8046 type:complete len:89 (+) Transcript_5450:85-351(+)